jgi:hypothetical protein
MVEWWSMGSDDRGQTTEGSRASRFEFGGALRLSLEAKPRAGIMEWWNVGKTVAHSSKLKSRGG